MGSKNSAALRGHGRSLFFPMPFLSYESARSEPLEPEILPCLLQYLPARARRSRARMSKSTGYCGGRAVMQLMFRTLCRQEYRAVQNEVQPQLRQVLSNYGVPCWSCLVAVYFGEVWERLSAEVDRCEAARSLAFLGRLVHSTSWLLRRHAPP